MNNGRDCPHGRQVGKCDTCDLIKTELELEKVTADRDALAAQIKQFRLIFRSENLSQNETAIALQKMASSVDMLPEQCLAAHDAEVAAKAVLEFAAKLLVNQKVDAIDCAKVEADQLRAKAGV